VELGAHFFRHESGRIVAALTRLFGVHNLALAEDVTQHAFCRALEVWRLRGVPEQPSAWLLATAKHRALDLLRQQRTAKTFAPEISRLLDSEAELAHAVDAAFAPGTIRDEQLRMMFSCCADTLPETAQIALILNILCGFGAVEIAGALLTGRAAIEKRIARGKQTLAGKRALFDLSDAQLERRLHAVRHALYLLFNEGYHGASPIAAVRPELCVEALRLTSLLCDFSPAATPTTYALLALMCLNAARLPARLDENGDLLSLAEQDRSRWDTALVAQGLRCFELSGSGTEVSAFHLEAAIAVAHASARSFADTDFDTIVQLYDRRLQLAPSPVVALNRAIALAERDGAAAALRELATLGDAERLESYPFHVATLGELELRLGHAENARRHFTRALQLARNDVERRFLRKRLAAASQ